MHTIFVGVVVDGNGLGLQVNALELAVILNMITDLFKQGGFHALHVELIRMVVHLNLLLAGGLVGHLLE